MSALWRAVSKKIYFAWGELILSSEKKEEKSLSGNISCFILITDALLDKNLDMNYLHACPNTGGKKDVSKLSVGKFFDSPEPQICQACIATVFYCDAVQ